jgi:hypothetical protein
MDDQLARDGSGAKVLEQDWLQAYDAIEEIERGQGLGL